MDMLRQRSILVPRRYIEEINELLSNPHSRVMQLLFKIVNRYGTVKEINNKAKLNSEMSVIFAKLKKIKPSYVKDLQWLKKERDAGSFISIEAFNRNILGRRYRKLKIDNKSPVILEISSLQYFPWLIEEAKQSIAKKELMPGRFIRVRSMKEQEEDGDLLAVSAAMQILGASVVETLDTKGTDGSNVHLGGPDTITGYFGGIGEPNEHVLKWIDEYLYFYTRYGVQEVLNINPGTIMASYLLYKIGINIHFKISVFLGNDNPYAALWTLIGAKLFSRKDGTTPLTGFNWSNSINNETLKIASEFRKLLGFEHKVRFEHHITEAYRHIVRQPYNKRKELLDVVKKVPNISAKHEGGEIEVEKRRKHSSSILDYFMPKKVVEKDGLMSAMLTNYLDKHESINITAKALTEQGSSFFAAPKLHRG
jgi:hypothetical protein